MRIEERKGEVKVQEIGRCEGQEGAECSKAQSKKRYI
jgi:hypothetical protein